MEHPMREPLFLALFIVTVIALCVHGAAIGVLP
jgi:hypothetical protein